LEDYYQSWGHSGERHLDILAPDSRRYSCHRAYQWIGRSRVPAWNGQIERALSGHVRGNDAAGSGGMIGAIDSAILILNYGAVLVGQEQSWSRRLDGQRYRRQKIRAGG